MYQRYYLSHLDALKIIHAIQAELEKEKKGAVGVSSLPEEEDMKLARMGAGLFNNGKL